MLFGCKRDGEPPKQIPIYVQNSSITSEEDSMQIQLVNRYMN